MGTFTKSATLAVPGLLAASGPLMAQSIDQQVNELFASSTGWFVNFIFSPFPAPAFPGSSPGW
jgi:AGCS family alanine or glycine:cation symporter